MTSPWDAFDDEAQRILRPIFDHEFNRALQPLQEAEQSRRKSDHDRAFAKEEAEMRSRYPDYDKNRQAILQFAVQREIPDLDIAYRAWRDPEGTHGPTAPTAPAATDAAEAAATERSEKRRARLEELRYKDDLNARAERAKLQNEDDEDRERQLRSAFRKDSDPQEQRRMVESDIAQDRAIRGRLEKNRFGFELTDKERRKVGRSSTDESRHRMDLAAEQLIRAANEGRTVEAPKPAPPLSRARREADSYAKDDRDIAARELISSAPASTSSAKEIA